MEINTKIGIGLIISLIIGLGAAYMDVRDRLTRMETQLEILAPVAVDHMVAVELEKRGKVIPPKYGENTVGGDRIVTGSGTAVPAPKPPVMPEEIENLRREKRMLYEQRN